MITQEKEKMICSNLSVSSEGHLLFAGQDTLDLAEKYGTPLYLMDEDRIRDRCRTYLGAMKENLGDRGHVLYASKAAKANGKECCYVYTIEVPMLNNDNHIFSCKAVNTSVVDRVENVIGEAIPDEVKSAGKYFRKYLGNLLIGQSTTVKK